MFSWTQTSTTSPKRNGSSSTRSGGGGSNGGRVGMASTFGGNIGNYPGRRAQASSSAVTTPIVVTGQAVDGSIRPPPSSMSRAQHLESYLEDATLARSTRKVSNDDTTYDTVFQTTQGDTLILRVNIPVSETFLPAMSLAGVRARHQWLDKLMRIQGYNPIKSDSAWRACGLTLGEAVHAVVKQLQLTPPTIMEITDKGLESIQRKNGKLSKAGRNGSSNSTSSNNNSSSNNNNANGRHRHSRQAPLAAEEAPPDYQTMLQNERSTNHPRLVQETPMPQITLPKIPRTFEESESCSRDELETLLQDELTFLQFIAKLKPTAELNKLNHTFLDENSKLALSNQEQQEALREKHAQVKQLQRQLTDQITTFQTFETQQDAVCKPPDVTKAVQQLTAAKKETFDVSEQYAEDWIEDCGDVSVDDFVKEFLQRRTQHHLRAAEWEVVTNSQRRDRHDRHAHAYSRMEI